MLPNTIEFTVTPSDWDDSIELFNRLDELMVAPCEICVLAVALKRAGYPNARVYRQYVKLQGEPGNGWVEYDVDPIAKQAIIIWDDYVTQGKLGQRVDEKRFVVLTKREEEENA